MTGRSGAAPLAAEPVRRHARAAARLAILLPPVVLAACGGSSREEVPQPAGSSGGGSERAGLPEALLVHFEHTSGSGAEREGWEIEVLQLGGDVRIRGSVRSGGSAVPIFRSMDAAAFAEFWAWIRDYPLDGFRVREEGQAPEPGWRKRMKFDAVIGADKRLLCENTWSRPVVGAPWLREIEDRLHRMVVDFAREELDRKERGATEKAPEDPEAVRRALKALGDAEPTNLPGGSPDAE